MQYSLYLSAHVKIFVEQAYRKFRKHGASMLLGTQGLEDLYAGDSVSKVGKIDTFNKTLLSHPVELMYFLK